MPGEDIKKGATTPQAANPPAQPSAPEQSQAGLGVHIDAGEAGKLAEKTIESADKMENPEATAAHDVDQGITIAQSINTATDDQASTQERKDAVRKGNRAVGDLGTQAAVVAGVNIGGDIETGGAAAEASVQAAQATNAINEEGAEVLNTLGVNKMQQSLGLGDGAKYDNMTDMAADAATATVGQQEMEIGAQARNTVVPEGLDVGKQYKTEIDAAAVTAENVSAVGAQEFDKVDVEGQGKSVAAVAKKYNVIDAQTEKDIGTASKAAQVASQAAQGDESAETIQKGADVAAEGADRLQEHHVITADQAADAKLGAHSVKYAATVAEGDISTDDVSQGAALAQEATQRAQAHGVINKDAAQTINQTAATVKTGSDAVGQVQNLEGNTKQMAMLAKGNKTETETEPEPDLMKSPPTFTTAYNSKPATAPPKPSVSNGPQAATPEKKTEETPPAPTTPEKPTGSKLH